MAPIEENGSLRSSSPSTLSVEVNLPYWYRPAARSYHIMTNDRNNTLYIDVGCPEKGHLSNLSMQGHGGACLLYQTQPGEIYLSCTVLINYTV